MKIAEFINHFAEQFDETDTSEFDASTKFRDLDEWDSMIALSIIGMVDEKCNKEITADQMRSADTIQDLFDIVNNNG